LTGAAVTKAAWPDLEPQAGFALFRDLGQQLELPMVETDTDFAMQTANAEIALQVQGSTVGLTLRAFNGVQLYAMKQAALRVWEGLLRRNGIMLQRGPCRQTVQSNLAGAQVAAVTRISAHFSRVRVVGQGLQRFGDGGLHFRFLLSQTGRAPVWPHIAADGRTVWPEGEDALHRPVCTTGALDPAGKWLDFDVFLHDGGRVTDRTYRVAAGDPVGVMGPSGRDIPQAGWIGLFGDETAMPAIARILAALHQTTTGQAYICWMFRQMCSPCNAPPALPCTGCCVAKGVI
jgi:ferric-chelate reductase (NADPH)